MGAVATKATADLGRRRLQAAVLAVVLFLASGAATLALNILVASQAPFEQAFARANGAHLVIDFDAATSDAALAATQTTDAVTASAGPWPVTTAALGPLGRRRRRRPGHFGAAAARRLDRRRPDQRRPVVDRPRRGRARPGDGGDVRSPGRADGRPLRGGRWTGGSRRPAAGAPERPAARGSSRRRRRGRAHGPRS